MAWFLEKPLFILFIGSLTAAILGGLWAQTGRRGALYAFIGCIAATIGLLSLERWIQTDRERITSVIQQVASAVERNDIDEALRFAHSRIGWIREQARAELPRYHFREVRIKPNLAIDVRSSDNPPTATAKFNVVVVLSDRDGVLHDSRIPRFVTVEFELEGNQWRVTGYEHQEPYEGFRRRQ